MQHEQWGEKFTARTAVKIFYNQQMRLNDSV